MTNAPYPPPQPQKSSRATVWVVAVIAVGVVLVAVIGVFAALGIYGVRKYIANAKQAEARNTLAQLAKDASAVYERTGRLCPSASSPVPATIPHANKYLSTPGDWAVDKAARAGFACLHFSLADPQYYQYDYKSTPSGFTVIARGDLDGDGVLSRFELQGHVIGGKLSVAPNITTTNPEE